MNPASVTRIQTLTSMAWKAVMPILLSACGGSDYPPSTDAGSQESGPGTVDHVAVVTAGNDHLVHWTPAKNADRYVIRWSHERRALEEYRPLTSYSVAVDSPLRLSNVDPEQIAYYRVVALSGTRIGKPSYIASSTVLSRQSVDLNGQLGLALFDMDGDGCLDTVGAFGDCMGGFLPVDLDLQGVSGLLSPGRVNRDSRFADYNGDGLPDIFTNVYSRADDQDSRAILHLNNGDGTFREDPRIQEMALGGFGETILVADFNNDGHVDLFVPNYWHLDDQGSYWLLINDGTGAFTDIAESAGISKGIHAQPEGAQALDFNEDGWIDIYVGSQLFINNADLTFTDRAADYGLPLLFDEGLKFSDMDLDGDLDFLHHDGKTTRLFSNVSGQFDSGTVFNDSIDGYGFGLNVCDINGDGFEDVVVANNDSESDKGTPRLFLNIGGDLQRTELSANESGYNDLLVCADLNGDNGLDILARQSGYHAWLSSDTQRDVIVIRILGAGGEANQQGRLVRITPSEAPDYSITRFVESGSGYMAQAGYDLVVGAPWEGYYDIAVRFPSGWTTVRTKHGTSITIFEDGRSIQATIQ